MAIKLEIVRPAILAYLRIFEVYNSFRTVGHSYTEAVRLTADKACTSEVTVKRAIAQVI